MSEFNISKQQLIKIFNNALGKTLGELDQKNVFNRTVTNPKITEIAGGIIE